MTVPHMTAIGALVAEVRRAHADETGVELSYGDIARRSRGPNEGKGLTRGRVQQIATGEIKRMPDRQTVEQLARGLRVPASVVVDRYMETLGVDQRRGSPTTTERRREDRGDRPDVAQLLADEPTLSPEAREHIVRQFRILQRLSELEVTPEVAREIDRQAIKASPELTAAQKAAALEAEEDARTSPEVPAQEPKGRRKGHRIG